MTDLAQSPRRRRAGVARLAWIALALGISGTPTILFQEDFEAGLSERWLERGFPSISRKNTFSLERETNGNRYLHVESRDSYSGRGVSLHFSPERFAQLCWRWRIGGVIEAANIERRDGDDAAAKLYVVFDGPSFWNPFDKRALVYLWDNFHASGSILANPWAPDRERMIVLESGSSKQGRWIAECVNLSDDYSRAFPGEEPPRVEGIAFLADTDNTHSHASASFDDLRVSAMPDPLKDGRE